MKIDIDKFVCSLMRHTKSGDRITRGCVRESLADQGLEYNDGEITEIWSDFKVERGKLYECIKDCYEGIFPKRPVFFAKTMYLCEEDGMLQDEQGRNRVITEDIVKFFHPATEEEISHEPKFKQGDWIVGSDSGYVYHIVDFKNGEYTISDENEVYVLNFRDIVESKCRLWTIQDAKDGDVLCIYQGRIPKIVFILKGDVQKPYVLSYYCFYNIMYPHFSTEDEKGCLAPNETDIYPTTQEQRDLLFSKMKEAGYEWDVDKKELRKIAHSTEVSANVTGTDFGNKSAELTEFEEKLASLIYSIKNSTIAPYKVENVAKSEAKELFSLSRKQIVSEISPEDLCNNVTVGIGYFDRRAYLKGIEDVITKIKEG